MKLSEVVSPITRRDYYNAVPGTMQISVNVMKM